MTSRPAAKKRHFAPTKGCPLAVLQWADLETSDPKRQRRPVDMSPLRQVPEKANQIAVPAPAPASPQEAAEPHKGLTPQPSPGADWVQEGPSELLLVPGTAQQQGQPGKQPPAGTARTAASSLWPPASDSDSEAPAGVVDFASDDEAEESTPGAQNQQLLARYDSDSEAGTDTQPKDLDGDTLLWPGTAAAPAGDQMLSGSTSDSEAESQHSDEHSALPKPQRRGSHEQPAAEETPVSDTSSSHSNLTDKHKQMADHGHAAVFDVAVEQASDGSPCPETLGTSDQVTAPEGGGLESAEQQQADGANSEASNELPAVLQWWQDPGDHNMQLQAFAPSDRLCTCSMTLRHSASKQSSLVAAAKLPPPSPVMGRCLLQGV